MTKDLTQKNTVCPETVVRCQVSQLRGRCIHVTHDPAHLLGSHTCPTKYIMRLFVRQYAQVLLELSSLLWVVCFGIGC